METLFLFMTLVATELGYKAQAQVQEYDNDQIDSELEQKFGWSFSQKYDPSF